MTTIDDGVAFDPTAKPAPDIDADMDDRAIGGLGMFLVREMTDIQQYERANDENRFRIERLLPRPMLSTWRTDPDGRAVFLSRSELTHTGPGADQKCHAKKSKKGDTNEQEDK